MAYIGKVELSNSWAKVEDLIKEQVDGQSAFAFDSDSIYQVQSEATYGAQICETSAAPADGNDGERIIGSQTGVYKLEGSNYLYAKVHTLQPGVPCLLKVSKIGE